MCQKRHEQFSATREAKLRPCVPSSVVQQDMLCGRTSMLQGRAALFAALCSTRPRARSVALFTTAALPKTLDEVITQSLDRHAQRQQSQPMITTENTRLLSLGDATPNDWRHVVDALAPFMREKRVRTLELALSQRRNGLHLVVENVQDPLNAQTVMRTAEGLGVQHVHVIESVNEFQLPASEAQATSRGALGRLAESGGGSGRYVNVTRYGSARDCVASLRALGLKIFVSDCPTADDGEEEEEAGTTHGGVDANAETSKSASPTLKERLEAHRQGKRQEKNGEASEAMSPSAAASRSSVAKEGMGWVVDKRGTPRAAVNIGELSFRDCFEGEGRGAALVFGNERRGCSRVMSELSDASFYLPMSGFTQSFNIGVALAMSLTAAVNTGSFPTGSLSEDERAELMGRWLLRDIKASRSLLAQAGLEFEDF